MSRKATIERVTKETQIKLSLEIDGTGESKICTSVPFLDHMLDLFARHGLFDLEVEASGDIDIDFHHTVEDIGIVLGQALKEALGESIARLPEREKLVVTLYYYEELTLREIGEVLGVTESRVSQLHTKAILRLKARLGGAARVPSA